MGGRGAKSISKAAKSNTKKEPKSQNVETQKIINQLKKDGLYEKLANKYKGNYFSTKRTVEQLVRGNKLINKPIDEIRKVYNELSNKVMEERNYTDPEKRNWKQIKKDELALDKASFALDIAVSKIKK